MPQLQNLILTDRKSTPVNHTFTPEGVTDNVGSVVETTGVPFGNPRLTVSMKHTQNGRYKGKLHLSVPTVVTETINGVSAPRVVRTMYADLDVNFPDSSTEAERNDLIGMFMSALATNKALVNDALVKLESVY